MFKWMGKVVTIQTGSMHRSDSLHSWFSIEEDNFDWQDWMFEPDIIIEE